MTFLDSRYFSSFFPAQSPYSPFLPQNSLCSFLLSSIPHSILYLWLPSLYKFLSSLFSLFTSKESVSLQKKYDSHMAMSPP